MSGEGSVSLRDTMYKYMHVATFVDQRGAIFVQTPCFLLGLVSNIFLGGINTGGPFEFVCARELTLHHAPCTGPSQGWLVPHTTSSPCLTMEKSGRYPLYYFLFIFGVEHTHP